MTHRWVGWALKPVLIVGLSVAPWAALAQAPQAELNDWREANDTVGQFHKGHADVLRWEQAQSRPTDSTDAAASNTPSGFALSSAAEAVRAAWQVHLDLASPLARLGKHNVEHIAAGHWGMLDPSLQRRIHGASEVLEVAATTRKAWITAVAAQQTVQHLQDAVTAAEAAAELGRRMVNIGNWSRYQQAQVALGESTAQLQLKRARLAAQQAEWTLLKSMGLNTIHEGVALPKRLPDLPAKPIDATELQKRLAAILGQLPRAEGLKAPGHAAQAFAAYSTALAAHQSQLNDVLKQREVISEETLLRYNGMLESVWGLLADVGERSKAVVASIGAQRDALLAETDLQWVLQGGLPQAFVSLGGGEPAAAAAAGH